MGSGARVLKIGAMLIAAAMLSPTWAEAVGKLNIQVVPHTVEGPIRVELESPGGGTQVVESDEARFTVEPDGPPGAYQVTITVGGASEQAAVDVPPYGTVNITYDAGASGSKISVELGSSIESITVTAQRVEQSMQDVPVAVTALTERDLEDQHITNVQKLAFATPNLWMEKNTSSSSGARAAIRGVGEDESMFTSDTPVGIYVDDIYIPRQTGAQFDLYDVERVEVLRGPQGTLYGRNTSAGAIKLITRHPSDELTLNLLAEAGNYSKIGVRGSVGVPVSDAFRFQVAGMLRQHDGYDLNLHNGQEVNDQDVWGVRATLQFLPSESLDIRVVADTLIERSTPGFPLGFVPQPPEINGFGVGEPDFNHQLDGDTDPHTLLSDLDEPLNDLDQHGLYASITWQATDNLTARSITAWREMTNEFLIDGDGQVGNSFLPGIIPPFLPLFHIFQDQEQEQVSQEFQALGMIGDNVDYVAGLYLFSEKNSQITENGVLAPIGFNRYTDTRLETESYAVYGSFNFRLGESLTLTAGGRWTDDKKDFDLVVYNVDGSQMVACVAPDGTIVDSTNPCGPDAPAGSVNTPVESRLKESWGRFTPRVALSWAARDNVLGYVDISTGFKSGAFDGRANEGSTVLPLEPIPPEDITAYELGVKSDLFEGLWRLNIAAFLTDFEDLQGTGTDPNGNFIRFSLGDVETSGVEVETIVAPTPGLQLSGNLGLLDTKFTKKNFDQSIDCAPYGTGEIDLQLKYSPKTSYRVGVLYSSPRAMGGGYWSFGTNYNYKSEHFLGFCNAQAQKQKAYGLVDAMVAFDTRDERWRFAVTGDNLTDEAYIIGVFAIPGLRIVSGYIGPPRTYTATITYRF